MSDLTFDQIKIGDYYTAQVRDRSGGSLVYGRCEHVGRFRRVLDPFGLRARFNDKLIRTENGTFRPGKGKPGMALRHINQYTDEDLALFMVRQQWRLHDQRLSPQERAQQRQQTKDDEQAEQDANYAVNGAAAERIKAWAKTRRLSLGGKYDNARMRRGERLMLAWGGYFIDTDASKAEQDEQVKAVKALRERILREQSEDACTITMSLHELDELIGDMQRQTERAETAEQQAADLQQQLELAQGEIAQLRKDQDAELAAEQRQRAAQQGMTPASATLSGT